MIFNPTFTIKQKANVCLPFVILSVLYSKEKHQLSSRRACRLFSLRTSVFYYQKVRKDEDDKIRF
ncbi:hypothetical protein, partial [Empedobacter sp. UBA7494]|uniref:hypothetical protein n=1 Tax=Empedobacter sp. UBA7494 TaxID=1946450 RepID=UPI0025BB84D0